MGPGGCEAPAGIYFEADAVRIVRGHETADLLKEPVYTLRPEGEGLAISIRYTTRDGLLGPRETGEVALFRDGEGWLNVQAHRVADGRRGYARVRTPEADPLTTLMRTRRCGEGSWIGDLRGRGPAAIAENKGAATDELGGAGAGTEGGGTPPAAGAQLRGRAAVLQDAS
jgi:hypothetical protein